MHLRKRSTLFLMAALSALLAGCAGLEPSQSAFVANADRQQALIGANACLRLQMEPADATSFAGDRPNGWIAFAAKPPAPGSDGGRGRDEVLARANILVSAGLMAKDSYEIYQSGKLVLASRYALTDKGRAALFAGDNCLYAGIWSAKGLVAMKDAKADTPAFSRIQTGDMVSYEATVSFELQDVPEWQKAPAARAAFSRPTGEWSLTERKQKVELVKFGDQWVSKKMLAVDMSTSPLNREGGRPGAKFTADDEAAVLLRMADVANNQDRYGGNLLLLPHRVSETNQLYALRNPGNYFFAKRPDPLAYRRQSPEQVAARAKQMAEASARDPANARIYSEMLGRETPGPASVAEQDLYQTQRKELRETLDILVDAGAMFRVSVKAGDEGMTEDGVLYKHTADAHPSVNGLVMGFVTLKGPLEQTVDGPYLTVKARYSMVNPPAWVVNAAEKLPQLKRRLTDGTATTILTQESAPDAHPDFMRVRLD